MRTFFKLSIVVFFWIFGSGCVSLQEYEDVAMENGQLKKMVRSSHKTIRKMEQEKTEVAKKNKELHHENKQLKNRVVGLKQALNKTQENYDQIFKKKLARLAKFDKDFQINPQTGGIVLEGDIFFNPGSATLKTGGKRMLRKLVQKLSSPSYKAYEIEVAGHTDADPIRRTKKKFSDNFGLSCARAHSVLRYITSQGVPEKRLHISGYSFYKPRATNKTTKGKKLNRRVEIVLWQPDTQKVDRKS